MTNGILSWDVQYDTPVVVRCPIDRSIDDCVLRLSVRFLVVVNPVIHRIMVVRYGVSYFLKVRLRNALSIILLPGRHTVAYRLYNSQGAEWSVNTMRIKVLLPIDFVYISVLRSRRSLYKTHE